MWCLCEGPPLNNVSARPATRGQDYVPLSRRGMCPRSVAGGYTTNCAQWGGGEEELSAAPLGERPRPASHPGPAPSWATRSCLRLRCAACGWGHPGLPSRRTELHSAVLTIVGELPPALGICWLVHLSRDCTKARTPFMWAHTGGAPGAAWRTRGRSCRHAPPDTGPAGNRCVRCPGFVPTLGQRGLPGSENRQCFYLWC